MIDGIDDTKISEAYNKLRSIRKKVKNKEILKELIKLANLPCVDGIYLHSPIFIVLYSKTKFMDFELEKKAISDAKNNIENISNGRYTISAYSVEEYVNPIYFFPSTQYYMNKTIDSGIVLFESNAAIELKKKLK